jgi:Lipoprotein LpqB beta-propeller domain
VPTARTIACIAVLNAVLPLHLTAQAPAPPAGEYACMTSFLNAAPNVPLGTQTFIPAIFGRIMLDGRNRYQLPSRRSSGTYAFNAARSQLTFPTGELNVMEASRPGIDNGVYRFRLSAAGLQYVCSLEGGARGANGGAQPATRSGPLNRGLTGNLLISKSRSFQSYPDPVYRIDLASGRTSTLFTNGVGAQSQHGEILYFSNESRIKLTDPTGNLTIRQITDRVGYGFDDFFPAISASGEYYALTEKYSTSGLFGNIAPSGIQVVVYRRNGQKVAELKGYTHAAWRPNGGLVVAGDQSLQRGLFAVESDFRTVRRVANGFETAELPAVSPDGASVAFITNKETWVIGIDGSNPRRVFDASDTTFPTWSPDGKYIATVLRTVLPGEILAQNLIAISTPNSNGTFFITDAANRVIGGGNRMSWLPAGPLPTGTVSSTPAQATPAPPARIEPLSGHFEGTYFCSQGETAIQLDMRAGANGTLAAIVTFGGTNGIPRGRYSLTGNVTGNSFRLSPEKWIEQPANYVMTALSGAIERGAISGTVESPTCSTMSLIRK